MDINYGEGHPTIYMLGEERGAVSVVSALILIEIAIIF